MKMIETDRPIGVFDSGVGGLTVLRALRQTLPDEDLMYLGDTARVPYGTRTAGSVQRYALQAAGRLVDEGVKMLVVACNTATAHALPVLEEAFDPMPVLGVIEPGASAAVHASRRRRIVVIATEGTVRGGAYQAAIRRMAPGIEVMAVPAPLLVALAEEGWLDGEIARGVLTEYLGDLFSRSAGAADTLLLGCTHFPVFGNALRALLGGGVHVVDSAQTTADWVEAALATRSLRRATPGGTTRFQVTDGAGRFARVAERFLGEAPPEVETVDLDTARHWLGKGFPENA